MNKFIDWVKKDRKITLLAWIILLILASKVDFLLIPTRDLWQYLFFIRVPILASAFLIALPLVATTVLRSMLKNLFVLQGKWQLTVVTIGAIMAGMATVSITNTILINAPDRFGISELFEIPELSQYILASLLGLPICITATFLSVEEEELTSSQACLSVIKGWIIGIIFLYVIRIIRHGKNLVILPIVTTLHQNFPGHLIIWVFFVLEVFLYSRIFFFFMPPDLPPQENSENNEKTKKKKIWFKKNSSKMRQFPALLYLLFLVSLFTLFLGESSLYLDLFRIPLVISFVLFFAFNYWFFKVDHFYQLYPDSMTNKSTCKTLSDFTTVLNKRLEFQNDGKTIVLVCASGGGIQAAGWTAKVLTGLQTLLGESFTKSIGLISSVSGGSVGAMYYLDRFNATTGYPLENELDNIFKSATSDSLDVTGWGLAYPDLWRLIGIPWLAPKMLDRGIALERNWQQKMQDKNTLTTLATWREKILNGKLPIPIFNATLVENGKRFLISPMNFNDIQAKTDLCSEDILNDFNSLYENYDIPVVTAARLSATFPYVSPICRNTTAKEIEINYHVADGGYFDNSGFVTILEWLNQWLDSEKELNIKRAIILQINPFNKSPSTDEVKSDGGWFMGTLGPLLALLKVRDPILVQRNGEEAEILKKRWESHGIEIDYYPIFFPVLTEASNKMQKTSFFNKQRDERPRYEPPLSWRLTEREKKAIKEAWKNITNTDSIQDNDPNKEIKETIKQLQEKWEEVKKEHQWGSVAKSNMGKVI